jgi:hypothetical protein
MRGLNSIPMYRSYMKEPISIRKDESLASPSLEDSQGRTTEFTIIRMRWCKMGLGVGKQCQQITIYICAN